MVLHRIQSRNKFVAISDSVPFTQSGCSAGKLSEYGHCLSERAENDRGLRDKIRVCRFCSDSSMRTVRYWTFPTEANVSIRRKILGGQLVAGGKSLVFLGIAIVVSMFCVCSQSNLWLSSW